MCMRVCTCVVCVLTERRLILCTHCTACVCMCVCTSARACLCCACAHVRACACAMYRVGQNRIYTYIYTVYLVISKPKIPYGHRIYMVLANPSNVRFRCRCFERISCPQLSTKYFTSPLLTRTFCEVMAAPHILHFLENQLRATRTKFYLRANRRFFKPPEVP